MIVVTQTDVMIDGCEYHERVVTNGVCSSG